MRVLPLNYLSILPASGAISIVQIIMPQDIIFRVRDICRGNYDVCVRYPVNRAGLDPAVLSAQSVEAVPGHLLLFSERRLAYARMERPKND